MTLEALIFQTLAPLLGERVYPFKAPQDVPRPYCVFTPISTRPSYTFSGDARKDRRLVQIDLYSDAASPLDAHDTLAKQIRRGLEKVGGQMSDEHPGYEPDTKLYRARLDMHFWDKPE